MSKYGYYIRQNLCIIQCEMYKMYYVSEKSNHQRQTDALQAIHRSGEKQVANE